MGSGLLLNHVVYETEAMHLSWFLMSIVPVWKQRQQLPGICLFNFESVWAHN